MSSMTVAVKNGFYVSTCIIMRLFAWYHISQIYIKPHCARERLKFLYRSIASKLPEFFLTDVKCTFVSVFQITAVHYYRAVVKLVKIRHEYMTI